MEQYTSINDTIDAEPLAEPIEITSDGPEQNKGTTDDTAETSSAANPATIVADAQDQLPTHEQAEIYRSLIDEMDEELEKRTREGPNNLNIFLMWARNTDLGDADLYKSFHSNFSEQYKTDLFENVCEFFDQDSLVTDEILFYWKMVVINIIKNNKKYHNDIADLVVDSDAKTTNFRLVRMKHIFRCFLGNEHLCYFKENGNTYYVS